MGELWTVGGKTLKGLSLGGLGEGTDRERVARLGPHTTHQKKVWGPGALPWHSLNPKL